jgi:hypothetical protein
MAELQFLLANRADIDAYRTQPFPHGIPNSYWLKQNITANQITPQA